MLGQQSDIRLGEPRLLQRMANPVLRGRLQAGPIIAQVVQVGAADHHLHADPASKSSIRP